MQSVRSWFLTGGLFPEKVVESIQPILPTTK